MVADRIQGDLHGCQIRRGSLCRQPRVGVASLELVLVLPLLLFVMALLINAGTSAAWKVRAQGASRDAIWRLRWPRTAEKPQPAGWPEPNTAQLGAGAVGAVTTLDFQEIDKPVARGPKIGQVDVNQLLLDPTRGGVQGTAAIQRSRPLLSKLGDMTHDVDHQLMDDTWTFLQTGLSSTWQRRIKVIYDLHENELNEYPDYVSAVADVEAAVQQTNLLPLTFYLTAWKGNQRYYDPDYDRLAYAPTGFKPTSPEFHPALNSFAGEDADAVLSSDLVQDKYVAALIDRIEDEPSQDDSSVPRALATGYINLYKNAISTVEQHLSSLQNSNPPAAPNEIAAVQAELDARKGELEPKIAELEAFIGGL